MRSVIINADDFGMSEGYNYGIVKSLRDGAASSTTLMVNLPSTEHAVMLAKSLPGLFIGLHANFVLGKPCADPASISAMVDENGCFYPSSLYRKKLKKLQYPEVKTELVAQMERFKKLLGYYPQHIECHAVMSEEAERAFYETALAYGIHTSVVPTSHGVGKPLQGYLETVTPLSKEFLKSYWKDGLTVANILEDDLGILHADERQVVELHFHPGYVDQFILDHSSMTLVRCRDLETLCDQKVLDWFHEHKIQLVSFEDLKQ